jgi:hypothetical protein
MYLSRILDQLQRLDLQRKFEYLRKENICNIVFCYRIKIGDEVVPLPAVRMKKGKYILKKLTTFCKQVSHCGFVLQ